MSEKVETDRRGFLKLAGLGTVAGGAAIAASAGQSEAAEAEAAQTTGYRETGHVRAFYESTRF